MVHRLEESQNNNEWWAVKLTQSNYTLDINSDYENFQSIVVSEIDETKPWKPATKVTITTKDGSVIEWVDANTPLYTFNDIDWNQVHVTAATAGHIYDLHIKWTDLGSKFNYDNLTDLFSDVVKKLPLDIAREKWVSAFSIDMWRGMWKEGIANIDELKAAWIIGNSDILAISFAKEDVFSLNKQWTKEEKQDFINRFSQENPHSKIQFQLVRDSVIVPIVYTRHIDTTKLFMVFGPWTNKDKIMYTAAPGRHMPRHPDVNQHKDSETWEINDATFKESSDAWFTTVMLQQK